jgi:hypothetical protein
MGENSPNLFTLLANLTHYHPFLSLIDMYVPMYTEHMYITHNCMTASYICMLCPRYSENAYASALYVHS